MQRIINLQVEIVQYCRRGSARYFAVYGRSTALLAASTMTEAIIEARSPAIRGALEMGAHPPEGRRRN
jgi:NifU-like protein involved in Fe-S cluster formation